MRKFGQSVAMHEFERDHEEVERLIDSDADVRLVVMISTGYLEHYLTELISLRMPGLKTKLRQRIFGGPLRSASSKYDLAEALGVIENGVAQDLRTIARIRNRFAHDIRVKDCEHAEIAGLCAKLGTWSPTVMKNIKHFQGERRLRLSLSSLTSILCRRMIELRN